MYPSFCLLKYSMTFKAHFSNHASGIFFSSEAQEFSLVLEINDTGKDLASLGVPFSIYGSKALLEILEWYRETDTV